MAPKPYVILKANGVRVAVIGAMMQDLEHMTTPKTRGPWRVLPVLETVRRYVEEVRAKSDIILLLGHITTSEEDDVLRWIPEIPITITGHDHRGMGTAMKLDGRVVVRVKGYGEELGRLDLRVDVGRRSWSRGTETDPD
jgi:2',3'-cyclic-nucleotide 2'-phosphodiesterase (5'-nucleotidase family)